MRYWITAITTFGIGDLATTFVGLSLQGVYEVNPTGAILLTEYGFPGLVILKFLVIGLLYLLSKATFDDWAIGVPIGLTLLGSVICILNTLIIIGASIA